MEQLSTVIGGTPNYTYIWSGGSNVNFAQDYTVNIIR